MLGARRENLRKDEGTLKMARVCEVCGKGTQMGNTVETRGKAKYLGGVGTKITGISRRKFKPNLQRVRITTPLKRTMRYILTIFALYCNAWQKPALPR